MPFLAIYIHYGHLLCMQEVHLPQSKAPLQENRLLTVVVAVVIVLLFLLSLLSDDTPVLYPGIFSYC